MGPSYHLCETLVRLILQRPARAGRSVRGTIPLRTSVLRAADQHEEAPMSRDRVKASLSALSAERRRQATARFAVLRTHLEDGVPLTRVAREDGVPPRCES
jgi:hypothetical protein